MNILNNLKTGTKLIGGFVFAAIITVVVAFIGYTNMKNINDGMTTLYIDRTLPIQQLGAVDSGIIYHAGRCI